MSTPRATETELDDAKRILRADYWRAVRDITEELESEIKAGNLADSEAATEWLEQSIDGSWWVTYTHAALQVLCWTEHDDAIIDAYGELPQAEDITSLYPKVAYFAMLQDVRDYVDVDAIFEAMGDDEDAETEDDEAASND